jgi:predicted extracellular nuclease
VIFLISGLFADDWLETFDDQTVNSYTGDSIEINGRTWTKQDAGNFSYANTNMGSPAFTINDDKAGAHITSPELNTCGTLSFKYAYKSGNATNVFVLQKSTDGTNFVDLDTHTLGASAELSYVDYSFDVNDVAASLYLRILSDNQNAHLFIEDFDVTDFSGTGNQNPSISNITQTPEFVTDSDAVSISADITDADGTIATAELHWGTTSGTLDQTIAMTASGDTYTTDSDIPAQADETTVYYAVYAQDNEDAETTSTEMSYEVIAIDPEPSNHVTAFTATATSHSVVNLTWSDAAGTNLPENYLIKMSTADDIVAPVDGTPEADGDNVVNVAQGVQTYSWTGLTSETTYYFAIYPYSNENSIIDYKIDGTVPSANATTATLVLPTGIFISEYIEGSSSNKAVEIYNGTGADVDLTDYVVKKGSNGGDWTSECDMQGTLANGDVYVIANASADTAILDESDITSTITYFNGNDAIGLFYSDVLIDVIGLTDGSSNSNFNVAGVEGAAADHTILRKMSVTTGTTDWTASAGTNADDSQWIVFDQNTFTYIGSHAELQEVVAAPVFTPAGGNYDATQSVTITCETADATIYYTTDGNDPTDASTEYTAAFDISEATTVKAFATKAEMTDSPIVTAEYTFNTVNEVATITDLRAGTADGTVYTLTGEAVLTYQQTYRGQKYIQDATAGILIDDNDGNITTSYDLYDGITGLSGTLNEYNGLLQFVPNADPGVATSTANTVTPVTVTLSDLAANVDTYESRLVKLENVHFTETGTFANGTEYDLTDGTTTITFRTNFYNVDYIGSNIFASNLDVVVIPSERSSGLVVTARNLADFTELGGDLPELTVTPNPVDFGMLIIGTEDTLHVTLANTGEADLVINGVNVPNEDFEARNLHGTALVLPHTMTAGTSFEAVLAVTPSDPNATRNSRNSRTHSRDWDFNGNVVIDCDYADVTVPVSYTLDIDEPAVALPYTQTFDEDLGNTTAYSITGDQAWYQSTYNDASFAKMSGFSGGAVENEDWLVTPKLDFSSTTNAVLNFDEAINYGSNVDTEQQIFISTDFDGSNPTTNGTWTELTVTGRATGSSWDFVSVDEIDLSTYDGQASVYVAFKYTSTTAGAATWEIDNISIAEAVAMPELTVTPNPVEFDTLTVGTEATINVTLENTGEADLQINDVTLPNADFSVTLADGTALSYPTTITAGSSVQVTLAVTPSDPSADRATRNSRNSRVVTREWNFNGEIIIDCDYADITVPVSYSLDIATPEVTIYDIQYTTDASGDSPYMGEVVTTTGIVTALGMSNFPDNFYMSMPAGGAWNGIYVHNSGDSTLAVGDEVTVTAEVVEYYSFTELKAPENGTITVTVNSSNNTVPAPVVVTTNAVNDEQYEGVLVKVENVTVTSAQDTYGQWNVSDGSGDVQIDDGFFHLDEVTPEIVITEGQVFTSITGCVDYSFDVFGINPRNADDLVEDVSNPQLTVSPNPVEFGMLVIGTEDTLHVTLTNTGGADLVINGITLPNDDFEARNVDGSELVLPHTLVAGTSYEAVLAVTPSDPNSRQLTRNTRNERNYSRDWEFNGDVIIDCDYADVTVPVSYVLDIDQPALELPYVQGFATDLGDTDTFNILGEQEWHQSSYNDASYAKMSGFAGGAVANEDWLVTPALNFTDATNAILNFDEAINFGSSVATEQQIFISTDYDGSNPTTNGTWTELTVTGRAAGDSWDFVSVDTVDLSSYDGQASVYIAFKYTSTTDGAATWEIDNIAILDDNANQLPVIANITQTPASVTAEDVVNVSAEITDADGTVASAELHWGTTSGDLTNTIAMTATGDTYTTDSAIPAHAGGTAVYYEIYAVDNEGADATSTEQTYTVYEDNTVAIPYTQSFDTDMGDMFTYSVTGEQVWNFTDGYGNEPGCMKMSGFAGGAVENEDWLITPALDFTAGSNTVLKFDEAINFGTANINDEQEILVSTDYTGGDPSSATWTELDVTGRAAGDSWDFVSVDATDLSAYDGQASVYVAFKYSSTAEAAATWEIDNISIAEDTGNPTDDIIVPKNTALLQNYPNPFNPTTQFSFNIAKEGNATLVVYNVKGQAVKTLATGHHNVGNHKVQWNGDDDNGNKVSSGVYFYRLQTADNTFVKKALMMK